MKRTAALLLCLAVLTAAPAAPARAGGAGETKTIRIIGTSDLHGKFLPWDYALNAASTSGSMAQLATAVAQYRTEATLLVDAGDTINGNAAEIFLGSGETHPMVRAMNALRYDVCVTGNHEYNYGMDVVRQTVAGLQAKVLTGNVYDEDGKPLADDYAVFDVDGVRVAVIGMVTPNIARWDSVNLAACTVTDPLEETRAAIEALRGQYDVLVGVFHMGIRNEYGVPNSGVTDILEACPEFDVMVSSHEHNLIGGEEINGVLVVQNLAQAQTMSVIDLTLEKDADGWKVAGKTSETVRISGFEADPAMTEMLTPSHEFALADAGQTVGRLEGGPLVPENEIAEIPTFLVEDTPLLDLVNRVGQYYSGAQVSAFTPLAMDTNLFPGDIRKCDTAKIYKYTNNLYKLRMTGSQLRKFMEWSAAFYNTWHPGDLTVSFNPGRVVYECDMFAGVNYEINIANEPGSRIVNLTWPDGTPVEDGDEFDIAVNDYQAKSILLVPGTIYEEGDVPVLADMDVRGDIGGIRDLIRDYIMNVKGGVIYPECDKNWRIVGNDWDETLRRKAVELLAEGALSVPVSEDGRTVNFRSVTEEDVLSVSAEQEPAA